MVDLFGNLCERCS